MQTMVSATVRPEVGALDIPLRDLMGETQGWGHEQGMLVAGLVRSHIEAYPALIVRLSLRGIERMDVTYTGELVRLASHEHLRRGFCLVHVGSKDLQANWDAAAYKHVQPLFAWDADLSCCLLGPEPSIGLWDMLRYVLSVSSARTATAAAALGLKVPNASNKLKSLWNSGYILRREHSAGSGGIEHEYLRIA